MKQRGRPRYPDVLTPRQWEVLALLREGLSNEQIAQRLGISIDGVKFHVSEILGKLGVTSRNEAARWQREETTAAPSATLRHSAHSRHYSLRRNRSLGAGAAPRGRPPRRISIRRSGRHSSPHRHTILTAA